MRISCSAEQKILEIPDEGEAVIAGYWSPKLGLCSQSMLLTWKGGKVNSLQSLSPLYHSDSNRIKKTWLAPSLGEGGRPSCTYTYQKLILSDCTNKLLWDSYFLLPGWIDAHVHLALDSLDFHRCLENWEKPSLIEENIQGFLQGYLERGIVAIRDGGDLPGFSWRAKNKVDAGIWSGPRVISVHEAVNRAGMYGRFLGRGFKDSLEWREKERDFFEQGIDQFKVVVTGLIKFDNFQGVGPTQWTVGELAEFVEAAHGRGILVMAHASGETGISVAIEAGVDSIEHGYYMTTEQLERMREKGIAWVPTVAPIGNILKYPTDRYSSHEIETLKRILEGQLSKIYEAYHLNVRLGVGTDAGAYLVPHAESLFDEMDWMVQAGIPKLEVFRMATQENARILGSLDLGRLELGTPMNLLQLVKHVV